jgi:Fic family protein
MEDKMSDKNIDKNDDTSGLKKILTHKSGQFVFSRKYDQEDVFTKLMRAKFLLGAVQDIPIVPNIFSKIEDELIKKSIFGTAAIEGNPLTEEEVAKVLDDKNIDDKHRKAKRQIDNLKKAYSFIKQCSINPQKPFKLNEGFIKDIHKLLTVGSDEIDNLPGQYRNHDVKVGDKAHGGVYVPPKILEDVKMLMEEYVTWINSDNMCSEDSTIRAALAHYYFGLIHPFGDGNGRTARIIEAVLLKTSGVKYVPVMLSNYYYRNLDDYFIVFSKTHQNKDKDVSDFLRFFFDGLISSLTEIKGKIYSFIRKTTLKDYYEYLLKNKNLTKRQYDLVVFLIEHNMSFSLHELFHSDPLAIFYHNVKSERTARRDVDELVKREILVKDEESNVYSLNMGVLDNMGV